MESMIRATPVVETSVSDLPRDVHVHLPSRFSVHHPAVVLRVSGSSEVSGHSVRGGGAGAFRIGVARLRIEVEAPGGGEPYALILMVGLREVGILGVDDESAVPLAVHVRTRRQRRLGGCG